LNNERNRQRIPGCEGRIVSFRKLVEVALNQDGAESAETHDPRSGLNRACRGRSHAADILVHVRGLETVWGNEGVDV
jgi:hypothetical protein